MKKTKVPNVVRGGVAVPLGRNYYYMQGRSHEQGGIDIGKNPRTGLEVEGGEVVHVGNKEMRVFSAQPFITNGVSPAQRVMRGENPNKVFNAQEAYKRRNKLNDDGTKKKAEWGMKEGSTADVITDMIPVIGTLKEATRFVRSPSLEQAGWTLASLASDVTGGLVGKAIIKSAKAARAARAAGKRARSISPAFAKGIGTATTTTGDYMINNIQQDISKRNKKKMGGLSRKNDYGSKSKPYPKVKSGNFAGGHRSYPIPTKADARDALRLAGLHGRSDVKAKVYRKYPELRKKAKNGGVYTLTTDKGSKLMMLPSTGDLQRTTTAKSAKFAYGGKRRKADTGTIITKDGTVLKTDTIVPPILGMVSPGEYIRKKYTPDITDLNSNPSGDNPAVLMTKWDFNINANKNNRAGTKPEWRGNDLYTDWIDVGPISKPNTLRQNTQLYTPYQWDDTQFAVNRQSINRAMTNRALRGPLNNGGYDSIEEGILQVRELGTGQSGTPEGFQWSGYTDAAASNPNLNYQSDTTNKRLRQWGFNPGIIERVGSINLSTPVVPATETPVVETPAAPIITARPADNITALARRGNTASLPTISMPEIIKGNINLDRGNTIIDEELRTLRRIPIPTSVSSAPTPDIAPIPVTSTRSRQTGNNILRGAIDWARNNPDTAMDALSLVSNVGLATAGFLQNRRFLNRMRYAPQPYARQAAKLKTRINIEPQLDKMRESLAEYERNVSGNTASSRVALARQQRARLKNIMDTNELYGTKENIETQLINKDRFNQQAVTNSNIEDFNKWRQGRAEFINQVNNAKAENIAAYINSINSGIQDVATRVQKRNSENRTNKAMMLANPNLPAEMLLSSGLITQDMYDEYRKSYPLKKRK